MILGNSTEEKFQSVEKILNRFSRRLQKTIVGVLPASPIFEFVYSPDISGVVIRRMFPASGSITHISIFVGSKTIAEGEDPNSIFTVTVSKSDMSSTSQSFVVPKTSLNTNIRIPVSRGDMFTVTVAEPEKINNVWLAFLYEIDFNELGKTEFVLDEFIKLVDVRAEDT